MLREKFFIYWLAYTNYNYILAILRRRLPEDSGTLELPNLATMSKRQW